MSQTPADGAQDAGVPDPDQPEVPDGGRRDPKKGDYVIDGGIAGGGKGGKK